MYLYPPPQSVYICVINRLLPQLVQVTLNTHSSQLELSTHPTSQPCLEPWTQDVTYYVFSMYLQLILGDGFLPLYLNPTFERNCDVARLIESNYLEGLNEDLSSSTWYWWASWPVQSVKLRAISPWYRQPINDVVLSWSKCFYDEWAHHRSILLYVGVMPWFPDLHVSSHMRKAPRSSNVGTWTSRTNFLLLAIQHSLAKINCLCFEKQNR